MAKVNIVSQLSF